jgi:hypothetical protein
MSAIPVPERINNKVQGDFYPLQREELLALKSARIINNAAYVHMALRYENPFCDRPIQILPREFAQRWNLPESSVYEALTKLKKLGILAINTGKLLLSWIVPEPSQVAGSVDTRRSNTTVSQRGELFRPTVPQQDEIFDNDEFLQDPKINSEISELIPEFSNQFQNLVIDSEIPENQELEPILNQGSSFPQTIQTSSKFNQTFSEDDERDNLNSIEEEKSNAENSCQLKAKEQKSSQQLLEKQKDVELELNSAVPCNESLQKESEPSSPSVHHERLNKYGSSPIDRRFSTQYQKELETMPDAKSYLEWAYKHCADGLPTYPTYPSRVIENNHHDLYSRYCKELETRDATARSTTNQQKAEKSLSQTVFADIAIVKKLAVEVMNRVR